MKRPTLIWFDMTLGTRHAEIDRAILKHFDVVSCSHPQNPETEFDLDFDTGVAICFEFDYPDRPGLGLMRSTKERYPHLPIVMLTAQHSERLAVWAYRNRVLDYFVKPISQDDLKRFVDLLTTLQKVEHRQKKRPILDFRSKIPAEIPVGQRIKDVRLAPAVHYVETNFRGKIRNADVAELCDMSQCHFSHAFTETFSLTFQEFVLRYRIFEACRELRHPNVAVANVAYSVGFNDPSYFSRVFRRYIGYSPSEYCARIRNSVGDKRLDDVVDRLQLPKLLSMTLERRRQERRYGSIERRGGPDRSTA